jgi:hypothetical protein
LLAHELAHVVQRRQSGSEAGSEERADRAASQVVRGRTVSPSELGAAGPGIHRQPKGDDKTPPDGADASPDIKPITLPWSLIAAQLPQLRPTSLLTPPQPADFQLLPLSFGSAVAASPSGGATLKLPQLTSLPAPSATSVAGRRQQPGLRRRVAGGAAQPALPSRIGITDFGQISLGLRFGLPVAPQPIPGTPPERRPQPFPIPGAGPSPLAVSDYQFELLDMSMTGKVPRGFDAVDKGDLIKASFGIVATSRRTWSPLAKRSQASRARPISSTSPSAATSGRRHHVLGAARQIEETHKESSSPWATRAAIAAAPAAKQGRRPHCDEKRRCASTTGRRRRDCSHCGGLGCSATPPRADRVRRRSAGARGGSRRRQRHRGPAMSPASMASSVRIACAAQRHPSPPGRKQRAHQDRQAIEWTTSSTRPGGSATACSTRRPNRSSAPGRG